MGGNGMLYCLIIMEILRAIPFHCTTKKLRRIFLIISNSTSLSDSSRTRSLAPTHPIQPHQLNLVRARGLLARAVMKAQLASPGFTHIYAALVAVLNTKLPENGELVVKRVIVGFRRAYKRRDKVRVTLGQSIVYPPQQVYFLSLSQRRESVCVLIRVWESPAQSINPSIISSHCTSSYFALTTSWDGTIEQYHNDTLAQSINQSGGRDCVRQVHRSFGEPPGNHQPPRLLMNRSHLDSSDNSLIWIHIRSVNHCLGLPRAVGTSAAGGAAGQTYRRQRGGRRELHQGGEWRNL
jgi:hypothetical protein